MRKGSTPIHNLDVRCAELGRALANIDKMGEKTLNAALSVLQEQGAYAMCLYMQARERDVAGKFLEKCADFLKSVLKDVLPQEVQDKDILQIIVALAEDAEGGLDNLLFAQDLLQQALAYARYYLKAKEASK